MSNTYIETKTYIAPGDVIEIEAVGKDWEGQADLHFVGWILKQPVFYLVHFHGDDTFNHTAVVGIKIQNQRHDLGPLNLRLESDPKKCRNGVAWISFLWRGAITIKVHHEKRSRTWDYIEDLNV